MVAIITSRLPLAQASINTCLLCSLIFCRLVYTTGNDKGNLTINAKEFTFEHIEDHYYSRSYSYGTNLSIGKFDKEGKFLPSLMKTASNVRLSFLNQGYEKEQINRATVGQGDIFIDGTLASEEQLAGLNRDVTKAQEVTKDIQTAALDAELNLDMRFWGSLLDAALSGDANKISVVQDTKTILEALTLAIEALGLSNSELKKYIKIKEKEQNGEDLSYEEVQHALKFEEKLLGLEREERKKKALAKGDYKTLMEDEMQIRKLFKGESEKALAAYFKNLLENEDYKGLYGIVKDSSDFTAMLTDDMLSDENLKKNIKNIANYYKKLDTINTALQKLKNTNNTNEAERDDYIKVLKKAKELEHLTKDEKDHIDKVIKTLQGVNVKGKDTWCNLYVIGQLAWKNGIIIDIANANSIGKNLAKQAADGKITEIERVYEKVIGKNDDGTYKTVQTKTAELAHENAMNAAKAGKTVVAVSIDPYTGHGHIVFITANDLKYSGGRNQWVAAIDGLNNTPANENNSQRVGLKEEWLNNQWGRYRNPTDSAGNVTNKIYPDNLVGKHKDMDIKFYILD